MKNNKPSNLLRNVAALKHRMFLYYQLNTCASSFKTHADTKQRCDCGEVHTHCVTAIMVQKGQLDGQALCLMTPGKETAN